MAQTMVLGSGVTVSVPAYAPSEATHSMGRVGVRGPRPWGLFSHGSGETQSGTGHGRLHSGSLCGPRNGRPRVSVGGCRRDPS